MSLDTSQLGSRALSLRAPCWPPRPGTELHSGLGGSALEPARGPRLRQGARTAGACGYAGHPPGRTSPRHAFPHRPRSSSLTTARATRQETPRIDQRLPCENARRPGEPGRPRPTPAHYPDCLRAPLPVSAPPLPWRRPPRPVPPPPPPGRSPGALSAAAPASGTTRQAGGAGGQACKRPCVPGLRQRGGCMLPRVGTSAAAPYAPPAEDRPERRARRGRAAGGVWPSVGAVAPSLRGHRRTGLTPLRPRRHRRASRRSSRARAERPGTRRRPRSRAVVTSPPSDAASTAPILGRRRRGPKRAGPGRSFCARAPGLRGSAVRRRAHGRGFLHRKPAAAVLGSALRSAAWAWGSPRAGSQCGEWCIGGGQAAGADAE